MCCSLCDVCSLLLFAVGRCVCVLRRVCMFCLVLFVEVCYVLSAVGGVCCSLCVVC